MMKNDLSNVLSRIVDGAVAIICSVAGRTIIRKNSRFEKKIVRADGKMIAIFAPDHAGPVKLFFILQ